LVWAEITKCGSRRKAPSGRNPQAAKSTKAQDITPKASAPFGVDRQLLTHSELGPLSQVVPAVKFFRRDVMGSGDLPERIAPFDPIPDRRLAEAGEPATASPAVLAA